MTIRHIIYNFFNPVKKIQRKDGLTGKLRKWKNII